VRLTDDRPWWEAAGGEKREKEMGRKEKEEKKDRR